MKQKEKKPKKPQKKEKNKTNKKDFTQTLADRALRAVWDHHC